ncbi:transporter substrate-binding domain-containing protein [Thalassospira sp. MA62]|nr:transporter substrate-binding domain-containing protein [Thalassospira sp. MA62]
MRRPDRIFIAIIMGLFAVISGPAKAEQTLIVTSDIYPPYVNEDLDDSFFVALFDEIGKVMGVRFDYEILPWRRGEQDVAAHRVWGTLPYRKTEEREKQYTFSDPIYLQDSHFFAYAPNGIKRRITYDALSDLQGFRIGGINGYYYEKLFADAGLDVDYANSEEQNFKRLYAGRIDLFPTATTVGWHIIRQLFPPEDISNFYTLKKPLVDGGRLHVMTSKTYPNNDELMARFNRALAEVKNSGTYDQVVEKYGLVLRY